jgi:Ca2+-binding EF-hand superfamily protein
MTEKDSVMSEELMAELEESFNSLSSTRDNKGFVRGKNVEKLCESLGLTLTPVLLTFYHENGDDKVYIDTFYKIMRSCFANKNTSMNAEIKEVFDNFRGQDNDAADLEAFELTSWLQKLVRPCVH